jgi:hypothetical protein
MSTKSICMTGLCLIAMLVCAATIASTASARRAWSVQGEELAPGTKKEIGKVTVVKAPVLEIEVLGSKQTLSCETLKIGKGFILNHTSSDTEVGWDEGVIELSGCSSAICGKPTEPVKLPPKAATGESVLVEDAKEAKPVYDDFLPESNGIFAEVKFGGVCGTIKAEMKKTLKFGGQGAANEGEGGLLGELVEPQEEKLTHKVKLVCPPKPTEAFNGQEGIIQVDQLESKACLSAEIEIELASKQKFAVAAKNPRWLFCEEKVGMGSYSNNACNVAQAGGNWGYYRMAPGEARNVSFAQSGEQTLTIATKPNPIVVKCSTVTIVAALRNQAVPGEPGVLETTLEYGGCEVGVEVGGVLKKEAGCEINKEKSGSAKISTVSLEGRLGYSTQAAARKQDPEEGGKSTTEIRFYEGVGGNLGILINRLEITQEVGGACAAVVANPANVRVKGELLAQVSNPSKIEQIHALTFLKNGEIWEVQGGPNAPAKTVVGEVVLTEYAVTGSFAPTKMNMEMLDLGTPKKTMLWRMGLV